MHASMRARPVANSVASPSWEGRRGGGEGQKKSVIKWTICLCFLVSVYISLALLPARLTAAVESHVLLPQ